jgi:putative PIG3 family NAD(P)H quinone oxidoreductase
VGPIASSSMHAITIPTYGAPDVLTWSEVPDPEPGPSEVLVDVVASAVNRADCLQRQGFYRAPPGASEYPGLECSGRVVALGRGAEGWQVGDEVCALLSGGGYAERVAVPDGQVLPRPAGVDLVDAAGLPEVMCTVWSNVFMLADLNPGETLLVHGGGSGIGTAAIQLAKANDAKVVVTAGSAEKLERCRELGADVGINYRDEDFVARVREETGGRGADVILDVVGAKYLARNVEALAVDGRLVVIGLQGGTKAELDLGQLLTKRAMLLATSLRARPADEKATIVASVRENVWPLLESGEVRPVVDRRIPLDQAAEAHRVVEASEHVGKVLLTVPGASGGDAGTEAGSEASGTEAGGKAGRAGGGKAGASRSGSRGGKAAGSRSTARSGAGTGGSPAAGSG